MYMRWFLACLFLFIGFLTFSNEWFQVPKSHPLVASTNPLQFIAPPDLSENLVFGVSTVYTSSYVYDPQIVYDDFYFYLDCETFVLTPRIDIQIQKNAWLGMDLNFMFFNAGVFDPLIEGFHELFGFPNAGRQANPDNQLRFIIKNSESTLVESSEGIGGLSYVYLEGGFMLPLHEDLKSAFIAGFKIPAEVKIPLSFGIYEFIGAASLEWDFGAFSFAGGLSYSLQVSSSESLDPLILNNHLIGFSFGTAFEWSVLELVYQIEGTSPVFTYLNHPRVTRPSVRMVFGTSIDLGNDMVLKISAVEEFFVFFVNADFGLAIELSFL